MSRYQCFRRSRTDADVSIFVRGRGRGAQDRGGVITLPPSCAAARVDQGGLTAMGTVLTDSRTGDVIPDPGGHLGK
jgi:hypothetical protein